MDNPRTIEFIRIHTQGSGLKFRFIREIVWLENPFAKEYLMEIVTDIDDVQRQWNKCKVAWENDNGIFFEYPDFQTGRKRDCRIVGYRHFKEDTVGITVVFDQDEFDDWSGRYTRA